MVVEFPKFAKKTPEKNFTINRSQVQAHLEALGYKLGAGDTVYLRSFYPNDDPRKKDDKGRSASVDNLEQSIKEANTWQREGRGVYFVVNGGGQEDKYVTSCRAIFYEHDNKDKQLQVELWRSLGLPEPSLQVDSGGKSIHNYWIFDEPCTVERWRSLQTDLLEFADADRSLKNPSRVMRLAGCWHFAANNIPNSQSQIILNSGKRYSYQDLRENIPTKKTAATAPRELQLPTGDVPLYQCLSKDDRALIDSGSGQGERNDKGAKLARNLIGTAARLTDLKYCYFGNPRTLFDDYCSRCSPPLDAREADSIWKSAEKDNPTATLTDDALENCVKAWQRQQMRGVRERSPQSQKIIQHQSAYTPQLLVNPTSQDLDEKLKLDLLALLQEADQIKKVRKRAEICSYFRLSKAEVKDLLKYIDKRTVTAKTKSYSLDELFDLESEGLTWVIPEMLPRGETIILAASPKAGKTLLAIDAAFAIATGEASFLGETVERGKVLLVSCDESLQSTKAKLLKRGFRRGDAEFIRVLPQWTIDDKERLETELEDFRPDVVIVDSLKRITHGSSISENSAEFADNIYTLKELFNKYSVSGLLIHHTNKNNEAMGVGKLRGSSAIAGAVWGTWQLDHIPKPDPNNKKKLIIDPKDPARVLSIFARDTEGQTLKIEFNPENNSWERLGVEEDEIEKTYRERILNILQINSDCDGLSGKQVQELLGEAGNKAIYNELNRMVNKRLVSCKPASGDKRINIYYLPNSHHLAILEGDSLPPIPIDQVDDYYPKNPTTQGLDNSHQNSHQIVINSHQLPEKNNLMTKEKLCAMDITGNSHQLCDNKGGEREVQDLLGDVNNTRATESTTQDTEKAMPTATPSPLETLTRTVYAPKPEFQEGDEVEFVEESDHRWRKGRIDSIKMESGYFVKAVIRYWAFGKSKQQEIYRDDWLRRYKS